MCTNHCMMMRYWCWSDTWGLLAKTLDSNAHMQQIFIGFQMYYRSIGTESWLLWHSSTCVISENVNRSFSYVAIPTTGIHAQLFMYSLGFKSLLYPFEVSVESMYQIYTILMQIWNLNNCKLAVKVKHNFWSISQSKSRSSIRVFNLCTGHVNAKRLCDITAAWLY